MFFKFTSSRVLVYLGEFTVYEWLQKNYYENKNLRLVIHDGLEKKCSLFISCENTLIIFASILFSYFCHYFLTGNGILLILNIHKIFIFVKGTLLLQENITCLRGTRLKGNTFMSLSLYFLGLIS